MNYNKAIAIVYYLIKQILGMFCLNLLSISWAYHYRKHPLFLELYLFSVVLVKIKLIIFI